MFSMQREAARAGWGFPRDVLVWEPSAVNTIFDEQKYVTVRFVTHSSVEAVTVVRGFIDYM